MYSKVDKLLKMRHTISNGDLTVSENFLDNCTVGVLEGDLAVA